MVAEVPCAMAMEEGVIEKLKEGDGAGGGPDEPPPQP